MTSPTDTSPVAPAAPPDDGEPATLSLKRTLRSPQSETWEISDGAETRVGTLTVQYGSDHVEGLLSLPAGIDADSVRGLLAWVSDLLNLDAAAGPGGLIHWVVSTGEAED